MNNKSIFQIKAFNILYLAVLCEPLLRKRIEEKESMKYAIYIAFIIMTYCNLCLYADNITDTTAHRIGIILDYGLPGGVKSFSSLRGTANCCTDYEEFAGQTFGAGLQYYFPVNPKWSIRLKIGYYTNNLELRDVEDEQINVGGVLFDGQFAHNLSINYSNYFTQIVVGYVVIEDMTIVVGGKLMLNSELKYEQYERIIRPEDRGVFVDTETRTRNELSGEISNLNKVIPAFTIGACYDLPLNENRSAILSPEIAFESNFLSLIKDSDWNMYSIHFGITISINITQ